jgi:hypothetical protein
VSNYRLWLAQLTREMLQGRGHLEDVRRVPFLRTVTGKVDRYDREPLIRNRTAQLSHLRSPSTPPVYEKDQRSFANAKAK